MNQVVAYFVQTLFGAPKAQPRFIFIIITWLESKAWRRKKDEFSVITCERDRSSVMQTNFLSFFFRQVREVQWREMIVSDAPKLPHSIIPFFSQTNNNNNNNKSFFSQKKKIPPLGICTDSPSGLHLESAIRCRQADETRFVLTASLDPRSLSSRSSTRNAFTTPPPF